MRKALILVFSALTCLSSGSAAAQFIGYTAPQTTQQSLATNVACTGAAQIFPVINIGQNEHFLTVSQSNNPQKFQAELQGIDSQGVVYGFSDSLVLAGGTLRGSVYASGYYPIIQVQVVCSPITGTFSISYSGSWGASPSNSGTYLINQIDKVIFNLLPATSSTSVSIRTPYGSSGGTIFAIYNGATSAGGSLSVTCLLQGTALGVANISSLSAPLENNTTVQRFDIKDQVCPIATVGVAASGAAGTLTVDYVFKQPGGNSLADPCQTNGVAKSSAVITAPATSTTQIVALSGNTSIYVCGFHGSHNAAGALQWEYGTGVACATGTTALTGVETLDTNDPVSYGPGSTIFTVPPGNALCAVTSVAGAFHGVVTYVQQ